MNLLLLRRTRRKISGQYGTLMLLGTCRLLVFLLCLLMSLLLQQVLPGFAAIAAAMTLTLIAAAPMRTETAKQLSRIAGILTEEDLSFLQSCSRLWLWRRSALLRGICTLLLLFVWLVPVILAMTARAIWLSMPENRTVMLHLLTVLHLLLLVPASCLLPLRIHTMTAALPYVMMKAPEINPAQQLRLALALSRGQTIPVMLTRLICVPALLFPFTGVILFPSLLCSEMLRFHAGFKKK